MKRKIYRQKFGLTVLSLNPLPADIGLQAIRQAMIHEPCLGMLELESYREIADPDRIAKECRALHNDGEFFTSIWEEEKDAAGDAKH